MTILFFLKRRHRQRAFDDKETPKETKPTKPTKRKKKREVPKEALDYSQLEKRLAEIFGDISKPVTAATLDKVDIPRPNYAEFLRQAEALRKRVIKFRREKDVMELLALIDAEMEQ